MALLDAKSVNDSFENLLSLIPKNVLHDTPSKKSKPNEAIPALDSKVVPSSGAGNLSIDEIRQKMKARIELMRARNNSHNVKLSSPDVNGPGREQLLGERRQRLAEMAAEAEEEARKGKIRKNRRKSQNANPEEEEEEEGGEEKDNVSEDGEDGNEQEEDGVATHEDDDMQEDIEGNLDNQDDTITFSKLDFNVGRKEVDARRKKPSANSSKHPELALAKISSRKKFLDHLTPQSRERAEEKDRWQNATKRAEGQKIFDNESKLQKMIKLKEKKRAKSQKAWAERKIEADTKFASKQKQRQENIESRKNAKQEKGKGKKKPKSRPGFEGSNRLKKSDGKKPPTNKSHTPAKAGTKRTRP